MYTSSTPILPRRRQSRQSTASTSPWTSLVSSIPRPPNFDSTGSELPTNVLDDWSFHTPASSFSRPQPPVDSHAIIVIQPAKTRRPYVRKPKRPSFGRLFLEFIKLWLILHVLLYNCAPNPVAGQFASNLSIDMLDAMCHVNVSRVRRNSDTTTAAEIYMLKATVVAMLEGSHYGLRKDQESLEGYIARIKFEEATKILCMPVSVKFDG